jgi:hypothetical protein
MGCCHDCFSYLKIHRSGTKCSDRNQIKMSARHHKPHTLSRPPCQASKSRKSGSPGRMTIILHLTGSGTFRDRMKTTAVRKELKMSALCPCGHFLENVRVVRRPGQCGHYIADNPDNSVIFFDIRRADN